MRATAMTVRDIDDLAMGRFLRLLEILDEQDRARAGGGPDAGRSADSFKQAAEMGLVPDLRNGR